MFWNNRSLFDVFMLAPLASIFPFCFDSFEGVYRHAQAHRVQSFACLSNDSANFSTRLECGYDSYFA